MAEQINFNQLYGALTPSERHEYAGYKIARNLGGAEDANLMAEGTDFQNIYAAEHAAAATKPSMWNPINWLFPPAASAERGIPATSAAQQYFDYYSKYGDNYSDLKIPGREKQLMQNQRFKQQQIMNRRKQNMQQRIRQAEAAKQKAAAEAAAAAAKRQYSGQGAQGGGGGTNIGGGQQTSSGIAGGKISHGAAKAARGNMSGWGLADGGLINFYRYGGFI